MFQTTGAITLTVAVNKRATFKPSWTRLRYSCIRCNNLTVICCCTQCVLVTLNFI